MIGIIGQLLPLMVAIALSTVPITVTVTILLAPRSQSSALLFLIGWLLGLFAVTGTLALVLQTLPRASAHRAQPTAAVAELVVGIGLLTYGVVQLARRRSTSEETELPRWLRAVGTLHPVAAFGLALALNLRPKALLLASAAAIFVGTSSLTISQTLLTLVIFTVVAGSSVGVPIVLALANPAMMRRPLEATRGWIARNSHTVTFVVVLVVGTVVVGDGMTRL